MAHLLKRRLTICSAHFLTFHQPQFLRRSESCGCPSWGTGRSIRVWKHVIHSVEVARCSRGRAISSWRQGDLLVPTPS